MSGSGNQPVGLRDAQTWLLWSRLLTAAVAASAVAIVVGVIGLVADPQQITGTDAWLKPLKFAISIAVYCASVAWLLTYVHGHPRLVRSLAGLTAVSLVAEMVLIDVQVIRGTTSHFNTSTPFDSAVFSAMGALVGVVFLAAATLAMLLFRQKGLPSPLGAGIRGGLIVSLLGMAKAGFMIRNGGHTVGAMDGVPGWPLTGWSTEHGDLRIAHFVGLRALPIIPAGAWLVGRFASARNAAALNRLVGVGSVGYGGFVGASHLAGTTRGSNPAT